MDTITLSVVVGEDRRLVIDLPPDTPTGPAELTIHPATPPRDESARDRVRAKLLEAGLLVTTIRAPEGTKPLSPEEILQLGTLPADARRSSELIDEDREERL